MGTSIPENDATFSVWELAVAAGGDLTQVPDERARVTGVVTDSRAVRPGNAFIALRGETFDGHAFLGAAMDCGATAVVVERGRAIPRAGVAVVEVDDAVDAFGWIARAHLRRCRSASQVRVAALTGSAGKTTTKELVAAILRAVRPCLATTGNLNNRIGVPAVALGMRDEPYAIFELGMSIPGEIATLAALVEADVAALLNVGVAHAEGFGGLRGAIAREKGAIFEALGAQGTAVVNADDEAAGAQVLRTPATRVSFGVSPHADVRLLGRQMLGATGSRVTVGRHGAVFDVLLPVVGEAAALDLVAAIAVADATVGHAIPGDVIAEAVRTWCPPSGRSAVAPLEGDLLIVDDSYNANPASMRAAFTTLAELRRAGRRRAVAVLGEMRELGPISSREHDALGADVAQHGLDLLIGCGGEADTILRRAEASGVAVRYASDAAEAGKIVADEARAGDVILFKGSRGAAVERALAALVARHPRVDPDKGMAT